MLEEHPWRFGTTELSSLANRGGVVSDIGCIFHHCLSIKRDFLLIWCTNVLVCYDSWIILLYYWNYNISLISYITYNILQKGIYLFCRCEDPLELLEHLDWRIKLGPTFINKVHFLQKYHGSFFHGELKTILLLE